MINKENSNFSKYSTVQLQSTLRVIRSQNILGATQELGNRIEKEIEKRKGDEYNEYFISLIKRKVAQTSITSSALRNQGSKGIINIARNYFENEIDLEEFKESLYSKNFNEYLDDRTEDLLEKFPENGKSWGAARKGLNLFFRDVVYNYYLREFLKFGDEVTAHLKKLEIPLDNDVAKALIKENPSLEKWNSIKHLTAEVSQKYQFTAGRIAEEKGIDRVHLDLEYWRKNR